MAQQTPHWTQHERALEERREQAEEQSLGDGMTTEPRDNGEAEPRDFDRGVEKLERVLGW